MRDVLVVPETKTVLDLIRDFQQRRRHMAIVVDEYGSTVGLVTAEDAIEQLDRRTGRRVRLARAARAHHGQRARC
jgi:Mg2+/Co2+ transporter CorC